MADEEKAAAAAAAEGGEEPKEEGKEAGEGKGAEGAEEDAAAAAAAAEEKKREKEEKKRKKKEREEKKREKEEKKKKKDSSLAKAAAEESGGGGGGGTGGQDIWTALIAKSKQENPDDASESHVFFVGAKGSGKTTLINRFLNKDETPKPTTALEYTFGRRAKGTNIVKDVAHIWELGGGSKLSELLSVALNPRTLESSIAVVVVDLSKPSQVFQTLNDWLELLRGNVSKALKDLEMQHSSIPDKIRAKADAIQGAAYADRIPTIILGTKFDVFQELEGEQRKLMARALRFVALTNGCSLAYVSNKDDSLMNTFRTLLSHHVFGTPAKTSVITDHGKALYVPAGTDELEQIGAPPAKDASGNPLQRWKAAFEVAFPPKDGDAAQQDKLNMDDLEQYKEAQVDAMRAQKNEELDRYRAAAERRAKELDMTGDIVFRSGARRT